MVGPIAIEPQAGNLAELGAKLTHLSMQELQIVLPRQSALVSKTIRGMMPIEQGIIKTQLHVVASGTGISQLTQGIAAKWRMGHLVIAQRGIVHAETIVMTARDDNIALARVRRNAHPFISIELHRVELLHQCFVFWHGNLLIVLDPFTALTHAV